MSERNGTDLEQARELKRAAENAIEKALKDFHSLTGLTVRDINVDGFDTSTIAEPSFIYRVSLDVKL